MLVFKGFSKFNVCFEQGKALYKSECYEQAICCFDVALEIQPNQAYLWHWRGIALARAERSEEAISSYDRALELEPNDCEILGNQAYAFAALERNEEAIDNLDKGNPAVGNRALSNDVRLRGRRGYSEIENHFLKSSTRFRRVLSV